MTPLPTSPLVGVNPVMTGGWAAIPKLVELVAVPPAVVTVMGPFPTPLGTVTVNWLVVAEFTVAWTPPPQTPL